MNEVLDRTLVFSDSEGVMRRTVFYNQKVAEASAEAVRLREQDHGEITFAEFVSRWRTYYADHRFKKISRRCYESIIEHHLLPFYGEVLLRDISVDLIREYLRQQLSMGERGRSLTPRIIKLQAVLGVAVKWGYLDVNPVRMIDALFLTVE